MKIELNTTWKQLATLAAIIALLVTGVGGLVYDSQIVQPGFARVTKLVTPPSDEIGANAVTTGRFTNIYGTVRTPNQTYITGLGTIVALTATNFTLDSLTQYAWARVSASNVISGSPVAHTLGITPTTKLCQQNDAQAATFTQTLYAHTCNATNCTIGVSEGSVVTFTAVSCLFSK